MRIANIRDSANLYLCFADNLPSLLPDQFSNHRSGIARPHQSFTNQEADNPPRATA
jgi:hypothetical protein